MVNVSHTEENRGLRIAVNLAGAVKDSSELDMGQRGFLR